MVQFEESVCSETERICWHMMATGSSAAFEGNPPGTVRRATAGVRAQHRSPSIGTVAVDAEPSHASRVGRNIRLPARYIKFPYNAVEHANIKAQFTARAGFPNVIRAIDCTHIAIKASSHEEFVYVNRKHFHEINVRLICDGLMQLTNIVARWSGSTHDSYILSNSIVSVAA